MSTRYAIATKTATQHDWETNWQDQPTSEAAMELVSDIQRMPEDYRQISVTAWDGDEPRDFRRFFRAEYKGDWQEVK